MNVFGYVCSTLFILFKIVSDDFGGHGNSFYGTGGRSNKRGQMRMCLRLIRSMVSLGKDSILQDFVDQGAINQINSKCKPKSVIAIQQRLNLAVIFQRFELFQR